MAFKPTNPRNCSRRSNEAPKRATFVNESASLPRRLRGFTLPELLISAALGVLLLLGAITFYGFSASSFVSMANYAELNNQTRYVSDLISRDIRSATSVAA